MNSNINNTNNTLSNDTDVNNKPIPDFEHTGVREDTGKSVLTGFIVNTGSTGKTENSEDTGMSGNNDTKFSGDKKHVDVDRHNKDYDTNKNSTETND